MMWITYTGIAAELNVAVWTAAEVVADNIDTFVDAAAIVHLTLVDICTTCNSEWSIHSFIY